MATVFRIIGAIAIGVGLFLVAVALAPLMEGKPLAVLGSFYLTQAVAAISAGIIALGVGQLIAVNERVADSIDELIDYIRDEDEGEDSIPAPSNGRDVFANVPDYSPRRDPRIVKEGTYRDHTVLTLEDGTVAVQTTSGWKRFRKIRDFDRLLTA